MKSLKSNDIQQKLEFVRYFNRYDNNKILHFNKTRLMNIINDLKKEDSLLKIRQQVFKIIDNFSSYKKDNLGLLNIVSNGDTIKLKESYIKNEFKQIIESKTTERALYYINRFKKAISEKRTNKINDINLNRWKEYENIITDSLWILKRRDSSGVHTSNYWGNFIPQIPNQIMKRFTKKGDWVLDTFAGCGTTLIEAQRLGRNSIGIELQSEIVNKANQFIQSEPNKYSVISEVINDNSLSVDYKKLIKKYNINSVQLLIMHPPYFDIIKFSDDPNDLSNASSLEDFLQMMEKVVEKALAVLDKGRYFALVIGDKYSKGEWIPLGFLTMERILKKGFSLKSIIVKNFEETLGKRNQKELWRYRALVGGFYIFKHEYIFLFKKR